MNYLLRLQLALFFIPVALAHYYSLDRSVVAALSGFASVTILLYASIALIGRIENARYRIVIGLAGIYLLSFYFASLFLSYYLQGSYFNQRYFFHSNLTTLIESGPAYINLFLVVIAWTVCVLAGFYLLRNRIPKPSQPRSLLVALLLLGLALDPGLRPAVVAIVDASLAPKIESLDDIAFEELDLNREALAANQPTAAAGKNLVLIFLEGLETIYTDERLFPGLTPNLNALKQEGLQIDRLQQVEGSTWTMAGLVSSLCGTPLLYESSLDGNEVLFSRMLDRATCLPDVLDSAGYEQVFMGGASLEFAGKGGFLREHGYDSTLGSEQLLERIEDHDYVNGWGLFDDSLLALAYEQYDRLASIGRPFNLTLLTIDTHHPVGSPSASCTDYREIDNSILHAVHCTDFLIGNFVERLKSHPAYADTVVVLSSDHLAMRNNAFALFPTNYQRTLYFTVLNADAQTQPDLYATPTDIAPTVLSLLGVQHDAEFLAGLDLLAASAEDTRRDTYNPDRLNAIRYLNSNHLSTLDEDINYTLSRLSLSEIEYSEDIENIDFTGDALEFDATGGDPYLILPSLPEADYENAMLYLTLETEEKLDVAVYLETEAGQGYLEENTLRREVEVGLNQMVFELEGAADASRIRIDPGHIPGRYTILSLEIRSS